MLEFDANTARLLDTAYQGSDVVRRRRASFDAVNPQRGETILDLGCGTGLLLQEIARAVGSTGQALGVDPSPDMRETAIQRCASLPQVSITDGSSDALTFENDSIDKAVSVQVFEYLDDLKGALIEMKRVLRPSGTIVVSDLHWDTLVWFSNNPARMNRMQSAWDGHFSDRCVPQKLPYLLNNLGFVDISLTPVTFVDHTLRPDGLALMMLHLMKAFAQQNKLLDENEAEAWAEEQLELADNGRFFF